MKAVLISIQPKWCEKIASVLWGELGKEAIPLMTIACKENEELNTVVYKARLTIVKEMK